MLIRFTLIICGSLTSAYISWEKCPVPYVFFLLMLILVVTVWLLQYFYKQKPTVRRVTGVLYWKKGEYG
mgnify:CR=1 FL=1